MRWLLLVCALAVCVSLLPATADAKVPCRNQVFNDWEHDGQISSKYPLACYRDALRHVPTTDKIYTSLEDDIRAAMQGAIARLHGKKVAPEIGHKFTATSPSAPVLVDQRPRDELDPVGPGSPTSASPLTSSLEWRRKPGAAPRARRRRAGAGRQRRDRRRRRVARGRLASKRHEPLEPCALGRQVEAERQQHERIDKAQRDRERQRPELVADRGQRDRDRAQREHAAPLVRHRVHAL